MFLGDLRTHQGCFETGLIRILTSLLVQATLERPKPVNFDNRNAHIVVCQ